MKMEGDVMKMRPLENGLVIPENEQIHLKPGGYHLMFMKLKHRIIPMDVHQVTLTFKNSGSVAVPMTVHKMSHGMKHSHWVWSPTHFTVGMCAEGEWSLCEFIFLTTDLWQVLNTIISPQGKGVQTMCLCLRPFILPWQYESNYRCESKRSWGVFLRLEVKKNEKSAWQALDYSA